MPNAYETLGVSQNASEVEIRNRYLELVRQFPPDRAPERFAEIRAAFDELRNPLVQLERRLLFLGGDSLEELSKDIRARLDLSRIPSSVLLSLADAQ